MCQALVRAPGKQEPRQTWLPNPVGLMCLQGLRVKSARHPRSYTEIEKELAVGRAAGCGLLAEETRPLRGEQLILMERSESWFL